MAYRDQPLGELALSIPRASALFRKYDMDYCCGGKQTLARAAARKELDVEVIEAELAKLAEQRWCCFTSTAFLARSADARLAGWRKNCSVPLPTTWAGSRWSRAPAGCFASPATAYRSGSARLTAAFPKPRYSSSGCATRSTDRKSVV